MAAKKKTSTEGVPATTAAVRKRTSKAGRASAVRKDIMGLRDEIEKNYLGLAELLAEVHNKEYYLDYGFKSFAEYSEVELETKYRKAMYFVDIWNRTKDLKISKAKLKKVGWTKAKEIVGAMTEDNADELLDMATEKSTEELREEMKNRTDHPGAGSRAGAEDRVSYQKLHLKMTTSEADVISSAIEEAKKSTESDNDVTALELVCMEWMQEHEDAAPPSLESIVEFAKTVFGVALVEKGGAPARKAREKREAAAAAKKKADEEAEEEAAEAAEAEAAAEAAEEEGTESPLESITTKKALREYIKEQGLEVSIKRGQTVETIKDNIQAAEEEDDAGSETETKAASEPTAAEKKKAAAAAKKKKAAAAKKKKAEEADEGGEAGEPEEDDINAILGID